MDAQRVDQRFRFTLAHGYGGHVKGWCFICLAHVTGPFRVEEVFALSVRFLRFGSLISFVARIEQSLKHIFRLRDSVSINRASLNYVDGTSLNRTGNTNLVAALRQDHVIETTAGDQRA